MISDVPVSCCVKDVLRLISCGSDGVLTSRNVSMCHGVQAFEFAIKLSAIAFRFCGIYTPFTKRKSRRIRVASVDFLYAAESKFSKSAFQYSKSWSPLSLQSLCSLVLSLIYTIMVVLDACCTCSQLMISPSLPSRQSLLLCGEVFYYFF